MHVWDGWSKNYERLWVQDWVLTPSRILIRDQVRRVCPEAQRILDVGCGIGQLARELAADRPGREITALDTSRGMIAQARSNPDHPAGIRYLCGPLTSIQEGGFDLIVSTNVLPYIPDQLGALRIMRSLLKPGGRALILHANMNTFYDRGVLTLIKITVGRARYLPTAVLIECMRAVGFQPGIVRRVVTNRWVPSVHLVEGLTASRALVEPKPDPP